MAETLPRVYAFEIENNLRKLVEELLTPIVNINKDNHSRIANLETVTKAIDKDNIVINHKLDGDKRMRDLIEDIRTNLTTVQTEIYKEIEFIEKDVKHYKE